MVHARPQAQILVVDDEPTIRSLLADILQDEGCEVATAMHGADALAYLHEAAALPKVILLDVRMPVMDGITFLERKQADPQIQNIPVILLSAHLRHQPEVLTMPVDAFLPKPVDYDLVAAIAQRYCQPTS